MIKCNSECITQALKVFESKECYAPERTRTIHLLSMLCEAEKAKEAASSHYERALSGYKSVMRERNESMPTEKLGIEHFDRLVTFWSR